MKILVTGGAGFIGSHIVKQLAEAGHQVTIFDDFSTSSRQDLSANASVVEGSIRDIKLLTEGLAGVDAVIHMASFIAVEESVKDPLKYVENNVLGGVTLLEAMRAAGVKKIVFSSSATVYGEPKSLPVLEDAPLSAANPYAASKIAMEALCESFHKTDNIDVTILRYFNPYGPGEKHEPETHAIPNFIMAGIRQESFAAARNLPVPDPASNEQLRSEIAVPLFWKGEQVRDFIYVEDLAAAHIAVLGLKGYNVFNVGSEAGTKIIRVLNILCDIFGYRLEVKDLGNRSGDVMANYASSAKLKQATGWTPKVRLDDGLKKTVDWFLKLGK